MGYKVGDKFVIEIEDIVEGGGLQNQRIQEFGFV